MNFRTKKIIAREFIILVVTLVITLFAFLGTVFYDVFIDSKIKALKANIANNVILADSLSKVYKAKVNNQQWFYFKLTQEVDLKNASYNSYESLWKRFEQISKHDSISYKYNNVWGKAITDVFVHIGFNTPERLSSFIQRNSISPKDSLNYDNSNRAFNRNNSINNQISYQANLKFTSQKQATFSLYCFLGVFAGLFIIRWIFYGIKWSIKTLKEK